MSDVTHHRHAGLGKASSRRASVNANLMSEFHPRPNINPDKVDFSQFHPLDHTVWTCRGYYGGWRTHLQYRWQYQWSDNLRAATRCKFGFHRSGQAWRMNPPVTWTCCMDCGRRLSEDQPE